MAYELLFAQLPERHGAGGGNVQGIDPVGHGDLDRVIAGCDGGMGKAVSLRAQHNGKLRLPGKASSSMLTERSLKAMAAVLKPRAFS